MKQRPLSAVLLLHKIIFQDIKQSKDIFIKWLQWKSNWNSNLPSAQEHPKVSFSHWSFTDTNFGILVLVIDLSKVVFRKDAASGEYHLSKDAKVACKLLAIAPEDLFPRTYESFAERGLDAIR